VVRVFLAVSSLLSGLLGNLSGELFLVVILEVANNDGDRQGDGKYA
jgi:hypothetical protein